MTCTPPPGTKPGTLHVFRKGDAALLAWRRSEDTWNCWHVDGCHWVSDVRLVANGWLYAGPAPDDLPQVPQTAGDIAREAIRTAGTLERTASLAQHYENALQAIADMEPQS